MTNKSETIGIIYGQLAKVMADLPAIGKNQKNLQQKFNFRGIDDIYNALQPVMAKHGIVSVPHCVTDIVRTEVKTRSGGTGIHQTSKHTFMFFAEDGSMVSTEAIGEGIDYGDKVSNKCASIAHKYAMLQLFCIPTKEDKDPDRHTHEVVNTKTKEEQFQDAVLKMVPAFKGLGIEKEAIPILVGVSKFSDLKPEHIGELKKQYAIVKEETNA